MWQIKTLAGLNRRHPPPLKSKRVRNGKKTKEMSLRSSAKERAEASTKTRSLVEEGQAGEANRKFNEEEEFNTEVAENAESAERERLPPRLRANGASWVE